MQTWVLTLPDMEPEDAEIFKKQRVNGKALLGLTKTDLKDMGFPIGIAVTLSEEIEKLKSSGGGQYIDIFAN